MESSNQLFGAKTKDEFLSKAHEARQARELARKQEQAAIRIQAYIRSYMVRYNLRKEIQQELERLVSIDPTGNDSSSRLLAVLKRTIVVYKHGQSNPNAMWRLLEILTPTSSGERNNNGEYGRELCSGGWFSSISRDCIKSDQSMSDWLYVLEYLINHSLQNISEMVNCNPNEIHILLLYLRFVNWLTSRDRLVMASDNQSDPNTNDLPTLKQISETLASRSYSKRCEAFLKFTETICRLIKGPRTELKSSVFNEYIRLTIGILETRISDTANPKLTNSILNKVKDPYAEALTSFLSVPVLVNYIEQNTPKPIALKLFNDTNLFSSCLEVLNMNDQTLQNLTSTPALCLLANLIHLAAINEIKLAHGLVSFTSLVTKLLDVCHRNAKQKGTDINGCKKRLVDSTDESYNHILGWLTRETAPAIDQETSRILKSQLSNLWNMRVLKILFSDLIKSNEKYFQDNHSKTALTSKQPSNIKSLQSATNVTGSMTSCPRRSTISDNHSMTQQQSNSMFTLRRAFERAATTMTKTINSSYVKSSGSHLGSYHNGGNARLLSEGAKRIAMVCLMLNSALKTLRMIRQDILAGLCLHDYIISNLWIFISSLGPQNGMKAFLDHLTIHTKSSTPEFHILMLFCECASHLISILDDSELYEQQKPFTIDDLINISQFLNTFVYRLITNQLVSYGTQDAIDPILQTTHKLLTDFYKRDCRRKFAPQDHWLMSKEVKMSVFLRDLEQGKPVAKAVLSLLPHIIAHKERVLIFRRLVARDKAHHFTNYSTFITIHRSRIVEDGYQQLARLPPNALKGLIRVKFINDHGLDEAGIDQDGVFKEFLEDTIKRVFDPALNLFSSTSEQRLYPSPTSRLHEDHLSLFNFVGKMLGKAVYEGIVVDVPFASFFLSRVLGQPQSPLYSPIDELPSLDPELYKSLTYIKHYEGDVSQLDLTFSIDQDFVGKIETYELEPGGKFIPVTNESRVRYIHSVANFRMKTQIEDQTEAFVRGFKSIVNLEWLSMFSASEFQRLISGDTAPIDLQDLRRNTKYFGGFHNGHRVVCWLWDILEKDFTAEEHRLFLKFVTSCSKPPLLGFANLEPPFSIRCVEVSDDQDLGDTVGSVLRGFFAIRRSDPVDRLPTSSTCFNLLKLPNYQRRSTLREKLRYAIKSSTGFELS